jgi:hypothetical protein
MRTLENIQVISYSEIEELVQKHFEIDKFCAIEESPNDVDYLRENITEDDFDEDDFKKILECGSCSPWQLGTVLGGLIKKGKLNAGNYLVEVCW